jgi:formylglycine-generating enzyme required for sulfatase activity
MPFHPETAPFQGVYSGEYNPTAEEIKAEEARERPQHWVNIERSFAVGKYDVTFDQWDACLSDGGCGGYRPKDEGWGRGNRPVINVDWQHAQAYVAWLNSKITGKAGDAGSYRLPTEAEWEYVARAGTTTPRWWTPDWWDRLWGSLGTGYEHCASCGSRWKNFLRKDETSPVGSFRPNPFGLYDMLGNVGQLTADCWNENYVGAPNDGSAWTSGDCRYSPARGNNFLVPLEYLRVDGRGQDLRTNVDAGVGFRLAKDLPE